MEQQQLQEKETLCTSCWEQYGFFFLDYSNEASVSLIGSVDSMHDHFIRFCLKSDVLVKRTTVRLLTKQFQYKIPQIKIVNPPTE